MAEEAAGAEEGEAALRGFFATNVRLLRAAGLWGGRRPSRPAHRRAAAALFLLLAVTVAAEVREAASPDDLQQVAGTAAVVCAHAEGVACCLHLALRPRAVPRLLAGLRECARRARAWPRRALAASSRRLAALLAASFLLGGAHWALLPLLLPRGAGRALPLPAWTPPALQRAPWHQVTYVLLTAANVYFELCVACVDTAYLCAALFLRGQLQALAASLRRLDASPGGVRACVEHHQDVLGCVRALDECFSPVIFVHCICVVFIMGLVAFEASTIDGFNMKLLNLFEFLAVATAQMYLLCSSGSELAHMAASISDEAYGTDWINMDAESRRLVCLLIHRAQKPVVLTGGQFYELTLSTFVEVFRTAFSYFTVLRQLNGEP